MSLKQMFYKTNRAHGFSKTVLSRSRGEMPPMKAKLSEVEVVVCSAWGRQKIMPFAAHKFQVVRDRAESHCFQVLCQQVSMLRQAEQNP
jgi:hypothetical protein